MKKDAREIILDTDSNDIVQKVLPHYHRWSSGYGFFLSFGFDTVGKGLVFLGGQDWVRDSRIINPAFSIDKLKVMVKRMAACAISVVEEWNDQVTLAEYGCLTIETNAEFQGLTANIITHTAFGSNYVHGKELFQGQRQLQ
ncbi:hypothetical protein SLEP1_g4492 [Rubroshorea leprosula]|uniref:Uncharacterized protein n=1 Tax=Rubroshorea leprosula TaxID=152421 RepID=A0AAV5HNU0_9ROSI|nr:hypothetical protein SLEP1_g4492 [Rubroshorea leprosula]